MTGPSGAVSHHDPCPAAPGWAQRRQRRRRGRRWGRRWGRGRWEWGWGRWEWEWGRRWGWGWGRRWGRRGWGPGRRSVPARGWGDVPTGDPGRSLVGEGFAAFLVAHPGHSSVVVPVPAAGPAASTGAAVGPAPSTGPVPSSRPAGSTWPAPSTWPAGATGAVVGVVPSTGAAPSAGARRRTRRHEVGVAVGRAGPAYGQLAERLLLGEGDQPLPVQLQQGQEPRHHLQGGLAVGAEQREGGGAGATQPSGQDLRVFPDADPDRVHVVDGDHRDRLRGHRPHRELEQPFRADAEHQVRQGLGVPGFQADRPGVASAPLGLQHGDVRRRLLVRLVLQQPGEEQVPGLQEGEVLLVLHVGGGQQPGGLQVEQGGGDQQELAGLVEVPLVAHRPDVGDELVGDLVQGHLGHVELVLADQLQQQVERAGEVGQPHGEAAGLLRGPGLSTGRGPGRTTGRGPGRTTGRGPGGRRRAGRVGGDGVERWCGHRTTVVHTPDAPTTAPPARRSPHGRADGSCARRTRPGRGW